VPSQPPATSTVPSGSVVAVWYDLTADIDPVKDHEPDAHTFAIGAEPTIRIPIANKAMDNINLFFMNASTVVS
jgi:hypothetical protein